MGHAAASARALYVRLPPGLAGAWKRGRLREHLPAKTLQLPPAAQQTGGTIKRLHDFGIDYDHAAVKVGAASGSLLGSGTILPCVSFPRPLALVPPLTAS